MRRHNRLLKVLRIVTLLIAVICILTGGIKGEYIGTHLMLIGAISVVVSSIITLILKLY